MTDTPDPAATARRCQRCEGRGWLGAASAGQFAFIGQMAMQGRLPKRDCYSCNGTGLAVRAELERMEARDA